MKRGTLLFGLLALAVAGCVSTGQNFDSSKAYLIRQNQTDRVQITEWFGPPYMKGLDNGDEAWIYNFSKSSAGGATNVKNLYVVFDERGMVKSFTFSTSFPGEMDLKRR